MIFRTSFWGLLSVSTRGAFTISGEAGVSHPRTAVEYLSKEQGTGAIPC